MSRVAQDFCGVGFQTFQCPVADPFTGGLGLAGSPAPCVEALNADAGMLEQALDLLGRGSAIVRFLPADIAVALVLWDDVQKSPGPMRKRDEVADTGLLASHVELASLGSIHGSAFVTELDDTIFVLNSLCS